MPALPAAGPKLTPGSQASTTCNYGSDCIWIGVQHGMLATLFFFFSSCQELPVRSVSWQQQCRAAVRCLRRLHRYIVINRAQPDTSQRQERLEGNHRSRRADGQQDVNTVRPQAQQHPTRWRRMKQAAAARCKAAWRCYASVMKLDIRISAAYAVARRIGEVSAMATCREQEFEADWVSILSKCTCVRRRPILPASGELV
jgi:hypothetical protein